jgi:arsenite methyltransferase
MITDSGFVDIEIGPAIDTFGGASGEGNARAFEVFGFAFRARKLG